MQGESTRIGSVRSGKLEDESRERWNHLLGDPGSERETREFMGIDSRKQLEADISLRAGHLQVPGCVCLISKRAMSDESNCRSNSGTNSRGQRPGEHSRRVR